MNKLQVLQIKDHKVKVVQMDISIDIFKQNKIKYDWRTLYVGLELNLIEYSDIVNYAVEFKNIIQLAWGVDDFDYENLLVDILKESHINDLNLDADVGQWLI
ncbi:DUF2247 family protein [Peribacillus frigoritolerans]|uniref:DUF2247 family protein n=1 Tax=Peribacillus frigoritolerans TaxID=450367 RepID=UPI002280C73E|nr:DUF2247 family protein [Peribacillus frigoritolerans]MCY9139469.1 DUF2247 family protein [Peribacillus frigoritolerans]